MRTLIILAFFFPMITQAQQDNALHISTGPKNVRKYLVAAKHRADSISLKQFAEERLRAFFGSTVYEMKNKSLVIFQGEGPASLITECNHDTAKAVPFLNFVSSKAINFFCLSKYLPQIRKNQNIAP